MNIEMVVAMAENRIIGNNGKLPWNIKEDLSRFKYLTMNQVVIMGRKTYESIGKPLPKRLNLVISCSKSKYIPEVDVFTSISEAITHATYSNYKKIMIIGGGSIYEQTMRIVNKIHITLVHSMTIQGDIYFPHISPKIWVESDRIRSNPYFSYLTLERRQ